MGYLDVPGARLHFQAEGSGPTLLLIAGAGGDGDVFRMVSRHLAERYTVVRYDRRGFSRSDLDGPPENRDRLAADADDARRLIEHLGNGPATLFGSSSGAIVALTVLAGHLEVAAAVVAHEPPLMRQLTGGEQWLEFFASVYDRYREDGPDVAMARFRSRTFPGSDATFMAHAPKNPKNVAYWFEHELRQYPAADLDLAALGAHADRIVPAAGRDSGDHPCRAATASLAARLGRPMIDLPGGHIGFVSAPDAFAGELTAALDRSGAGPAHPGGDARPGGSPGSMHAGDWNDSYAGTPHWDLGRPQPAMQELADRGEIRGRVLDVGCGTGEHVLMCAALGLDSTGVDIAPAALHAARQRAEHRGLSARFLLGDAHHLAELGDTYDTVLDVGLFHIFGDEDRASYVRSLRDVVAPGGRYLMLCFSDREPGSGGPRRVSADEIATTFADGWRIEALAPTVLTNPAGPAGIHGWRLIAVRS